MTKGSNETPNQSQPRVDGLGAVGVSSKPIEPQGLRYGNYKKHNLGYPVQEGQNWHDLTPNQRRQWFQGHENRWKQRMNSRMGEGSGMSPSLSFGQG